MLGRYRWESDLTVEQLVEVVAEHVPRLHEADKDRDRLGEKQIAYGSNVVYQYDESGKLIFYNFSDGVYGVTETVLTCRVVTGKDGHGTVLTGGIPWVSGFLTFVFFVVLMFSSRTSGLLGTLDLVWEFPPMLILIIPTICWFLVWREQTRKKVLDLLDDITGSSWMAARKKKKA